MTSRSTGVRWLPTAAVGVTVLLWASAFVAIRHVGDEISPGALSLGRLAVASLVLGGFVLAGARRGRSAGVHGDPARADQVAGGGAAGPAGGATAVRPGGGWPTRSGWALVVVCGVAWFGIYNVALNAAEQRLDAGTAAMLVNIGPLLIAVLAGLLLGEGFPGRVLAGCAVAFAGVLLIGASTAPGGTADLWGVVLCVVAAVAYAVGVVSQKPLLRSVSPVRITWLACTVGAVACLPFTGDLVREVGAATPGTIAWIGYLGVMPTAVAFTTWAYALARTSAGQLGASSYLVPPVAVLLGWVLLGETPAPLAYLGGAVCLGGVYLSRRTRPNRAARAGSGSDQAARAGSDLSRSST